MKGVDGMRGSKRKQGKDSWRLTISMGKNPDTEKYDRYQETFIGKGPDADKRIIELCSQFERGIDINPKKITFSEYLDKWLKDFGKTNLSPRTLESYESIIDRHLKPELGAIQLSKLSPAHLREFYTKSLTDGRVDNKQTKGKALTANTVHHFHRLIHLALKQAVRWELIFRNVADAVDPPKQQSENDEGSKDLVFLTEQEIETLFKTLKPTYAYLPAYIAVNTGMRIGEVLGLRWQDVDLEGKTLTIKQTLQTIKREIRVRNRAKTKGSRRTIDLPDNLIAVLKKEQTQQETQKRWTYKDVYQDHDLVCAREDGAPIKPSSFGSYFVTLAHRAGLNISFHTLRHTHASLLLKAGEYPKVISERLGHSQIGITMDIYSHVMPGMQKQAAEKIDLILAGRL
jgi:integrase